MSILEARNLSKTYILGDKEITVLDRISLSVDKGEFLVVRGRSGSGKSTLLSLLSGLDRPTAGNVLIQNEDITDWSEDRLASLRSRTIGFVFQSFHLVPSLTALENVMFPAELLKDPRARAKAEALLDQTDLTHRSGSYPHQLSGGEKQRVAICRAVVNRPEIIFADEPTGNLDLRSGERVLRLLLDIHKDRHNALILVTHSREIARLADRVIILSDGKIEADSVHAA